MTADFRGGGCSTREVPRGGVYGFRAIFCFCKNKYKASLSSLRRRRSFNDTIILRDGQTSPQRPRLVLVINTHFYANAEYKDKGYNGKGYQSIEDTVRHEETPGIQNLLSVFALSVHGTGGLQHSWLGWAFCGSYAPQLRMCLHRMPHFLDCIVICAISCRVVYHHILSKSGVYCKMILFGQLSLYAAGQKLFTCMIWVV